MSKKRYMELLLEQIRNKRAKELVAHEITSHIEDQEEAYRAQGLTAYDAERRAVLDMGDPVETGVSLDAVHKPKMSWSMVILTAIISLLGVFTIGMICKGTSDFTTISLLRKQIIYLMIGFGIMLFICKTDYSRIFQHSGILAILYLVFLILQDMQFVRLFSNAVTIPYLLSIPIFCGLLYKFRKRSWYHLLIPVGFMLASILLMRYQWFFASYKLVLVFISAVLVTVVICNNWYPVHKRIVLPTMEAVDQGILEPIDVPECRDELGRLILRYNGMVEQIQRLMEEQYILGKEKSEAQLHALQAQISPHFLYNTLDMMKWMAVKGETDNIRAVLSAMSRFYRMVLSRGAYIITIGEEIRMCQAYMEIQVLRKKNKLQFEVDVDEEIYPYLIPKITLQPILENAVLHGIDEKEGGRGTIRLSGRIQEDQIILEVQDDGVGMDPALLSEENLSEHSGKHYGLSNVRTRLWLFYEKNAELSCSSAPGLGTKITLRFPKKSDVEDTDG